MTSEIFIKVFIRLKDESVAYSFGKKLSHGKVEIAMINIKNLILTLILPILISSCGGGGGGGTPPSGFTQTYISSAAQGELIQYSVNTTDLTYSYTVIRSQYGCDVITNPCHTGSGTLTKNSDGSFSTTSNAAVKFYALKSGLLVGTIKINDMPATPLIGLPNSISDSTLLAGVYNYISVNCASKTAGVMTGCLGNYGTVKVTQTGSGTASFVICESNDVDSAPLSCANTVNGTGVYDPSLSAWKFVRDGATNENFMVAYTAKNGQKVAYIDLNDSGGLGYGQATLSEKVTLLNSGFASAAGNWYLVSLAPNGDSTSAVITASADGSVSSGGSMVLNTPWNGFIGNTQDVRGKFIMSGNGVFTYGGWTDNLGRPKYMIGMQM